MGRPERDELFGRMSQRASRLHFEFHNTHGTLIDEFDVMRDCSQPRGLAD